jgi:hypothetical protein
MPGGEKLCQFTAAASSGPWVFLPSAESLPHPDVILSVLPTDGGDSIPRIGSLRSALTEGLDAPCVASFPSGPRSQMASEVSASPLGRIAPSTWTDCPG